MNLVSYSSLFKVLLFACGFIVVSASQNDRELENPLLDNWGKDEGLASFLHDIIESSKTKSPTPGPTTENPTTAPTDRPTATPTESPSKTPTQIPTEIPTTVSPTASFHPSVQPTIHPTPQPSIAPSKSAVPTATPSDGPSAGPTLEPSIEPSVSPTDEPSGSPSVEPSVEPTSEPSGGPSLIPSNSPSVSLGPTVASSSSPSLGSSTSSPPSLLPTNTKTTETSIIINQKSYRNATPLLIVGACCFLIMVSTSLFLYSRGSQSRRDNNNGAPEMIELSTRDRIIGSPWSVEEILRPSGTFDDENYMYTTKEGQLVEIDLEAGQVLDERHNNFSNTIDGPLTPSNSKLCMPKSIYFPKMFQRTRDGEESTKEVITWNQIREEDSSHGSSGYAPASACSPMLSPFLVKGLSSILSPQLRGTIILNEPSVKKEDEGESVAHSRSTRKHAARKGHGGEKMESATKEVGLNREITSHRDIFAMPIKHDPGDSSNEQYVQRTELKTVASRSSDGSSIEWGIDVSKVEKPSKESFEANMAELKNILVSIKSMGSGEAPDTEDDVVMTYTETEDSSDPNNDIRNKLSPKSDSSACLGIDIAPIESRSTRSEPSSVQIFNSPPSKTHSPGIAYERELLSNKINDGGTFNFRNIFNDPINDLYQCHAPSGPLGIVVDTTSLGPRVRSLNPLSPIFGKISPGDVIVGVDEVDTVGMEAGKFWQVVSQKANQNQRVLTMLRI